VLSLSSEATAPRLSIDSTDIVRSKLATLSIQKIVANKGVWSDLPKKYEQSQISLEKQWSDHKTSAPGCRFFRLQLPVMKGVRRLKAACSKSNCVSPAIASAIFIAEYCTRRHADTVFSQNCLCASLFLQKMLQF